MLKMMDGGSILLKSEQGEHLIVCISNKVFVISASKAQEKPVDIIYKMLSFGGLKMGVWSFDNRFREA